MHLVQSSLYVVSILVQLVTVRRNSETHRRICRVCCKGAAKKEIGKINICPKGHKIPMNKHYCKVLIKSNYRGHTLTVTNPLRSGHSEQDPISPCYNDVQRFLH